MQNKSHTAQTSLYIATRTVAVLCMLLALPLSLYAGEKPIKILAIGNSFSANAIEHNLYEIAHEAGIEIVLGNALFGGRGINAHYNAAMNNIADYTYQKVVDGKLKESTGWTLERIICDEAWDYITFQQASAQSGMPETIEPALTLLIQYVTEVATGDKDPIYGYHQTWAYETNSEHVSFNNYNYDQQKMYDCIMKTSREIMENHPELSFIIPCGTAVQNLRQTEAASYLSKDGHHLAGDENYVGQYLASCTWAATILDIDLSQITFQPLRYRNDIKYLALARLAAMYAVQSPYSVTDPNNPYSAILDTHTDSSEKERRASIPYTLDGRNALPFSKGIYIKGGKTIITNYHGY